VVDTLNVLFNNTHIEATNAKCQAAKSPSDSHIKTGLPTNKE